MSDDDSGSGILRILAPALEGGEEDVWSSASGLNSPRTLGNLGNSTFFDSDVRLTGSAQSELFRIPGWSMCSFSSESILLTKYRAAKGTCVSY